MQLNTDMAACTTRLHTCTHMPQPAPIRAINYAKHQHGERASAIPGQKRGGAPRYDALARTLLHSAFHMWSLKCTWTAQCNGKQVHELTMQYSKRDSYIMICIRVRVKAERERCHPQHVYTMYMCIVHITRYMYCAGSIIIM